jgi:hypothetical protein
MPHLSRSRLLVLAISLTLTLTSSSWAASQERVLYSFTGRGDGAHPQSTLIFDGNGSLYGTASNGGSIACVGAVSGCGTVFELSPFSDGAWTQKVLYSFQGGADGAVPNSLVFDREGNLYGTTLVGGGTGCLNSAGAGCGTVFKLMYTHGQWVESVLYRFQGGADGGFPEGVMFDGAGHLFGTTACSGIGCSGESNCGVVFELTPSHVLWKEAVLSYFCSANGETPNPGLVFGPAGTIFGTTWGGGDGQICQCGTIFLLRPNGQGQWNQTVLHSFGAGPNGGQPAGGLIADKEGNLYGPIYYGGTGGAGTLFEFSRLSPSYDGRHFNLIWDFDSTNIAQPDSVLNSDSQGNLYGTTDTNLDYRTCFCGAVFKLIRSDNGSWQETTLYEFTGGSDGAYPLARVILDSAGNLYGTTYVGGTGDCTYQGTGCGVVYQIMQGIANPDQ